MKMRDPTPWMWGEALGLLERADRLHRQFFQLCAQRHACPTWEPPVDMFETESQVVVVVALPGVAPEQLLIDVDKSAIVVRGQRRLPSPGSGARIHRLELPYGHFERRIELPARPLQLNERNLVHGCLTLVFDKLGAAP